MELSFVLSTKLVLGDLGKSRMNKMMLPPQGLQPTGESNPQALAISWCEFQDGYRGAIGAHSSYPTEMERWVESAVWAWKGKMAQRVGIARRRGWRAISIVSPRSRREASTAGSCGVWARRCWQCMERQTETSMCRNLEKKKARITELNE